MNHRLKILLGLFAMTCSAVTYGGIPEPDAIVFGQVCLKGGAATDQDDVTIIATTVVGKETVEVGRYKMGDLDSASDCDGDTDCYVLRIRLESVPVGTTSSGKAVVISGGGTPSVQLFAVIGANPEALLASVDITDRGMIARLDLSVATPTGDLNTDGFKNLVDHQLFVQSFQGPAVAKSIACNPADLNGDGFVDLRDAALMQSALTTTTP